MKVMCALGKYQYGDPARGLGTEYAAFIPALERLGHQVVHFDLWDRRPYPTFAHLNRALLEAVAREAPDVLLAVPMHYEIWLETLEILKQRTHVATICWTTDDSWKYREVSRFVGKSYHAITTTYPHVLPLYRRDGIHQVLLTQWAANAEALNPPRPAAACRYGVTFVGTAHGNRKRRIKALQRQGVQVRCFGHGWPSGPVAAEEIPAIMRDSVISLNFANARGGNQIKARTFEVPGAGGFLLTEHAPGLERYYEPGREIAAFRTTAELLEKIAYFLARPAERDAVARRGHHRTCREHTYEARLAEVLTFALEAREREGGGRSLALSFDRAAAAHQVNRPLKALRRALLIPCTLFWGEDRGARAARRLAFELSWRIFKGRTFSAAGLPGRLFPEL